MSLEEAVDYVLSEGESESPTSQAAEEPSAEELPTALTPREREVATLVARELTNRQIAACLTLSEHTVATHVRNILKKLGLHSRKQIATWIMQHQPLQ